jgi:hypothetical protein
VRALRLSSRPPKAGAPLPADLATKLVEGAGAALTADAAPERWVAVLDALAFAPVRDKVIPASLPKDLHEDVKGTIARLATRIPKIAHIFEITPDPTAPRPKVERRRPNKPKAKQEPKPKQEPKAKQEPKPKAATPDTAETPAEAATTQAVDAPVAEAPVTEAPAPEPVAEPEPAAEAEPATEAPAPEPVAEPVAETEPAAESEPVAEQEPVSAPASPDPEA